MESVSPQSTQVQAQDEGVSTQVQKQPKDVVTRTVAVRDRKTKIGVKRVAVLHYQFNRETKTLTYGATLFKPESSRQKFDFAGHAQTAEKRFNKYPVVVTDVKDDGSLGDFNKYLRSLLFKHGCHSKASSGSAASAASV